MVAPAGLTLGGGCEIVLHAARVQAHAETYMGLVEVGVGLIPAGGGTKEMLARAMEAVPDAAIRCRHVQRVFETIGFAKVSTSGARRRGGSAICATRDGITMNRDRLLADAKAQALASARRLSPPRVRATAIRVGGESMLAALEARRASRLARRTHQRSRRAHRPQAGVDPRGRQRRTHATTLTEQQMLDLEREAFLSLCGERKTLERIAHTLKTGKPLRN